MKLFVKKVDGFNKVETRSWRFRSRYIQSGSVLKRGCGTGVGMGPNGSALPLCGSLFSIKL